MAVLSPVGAWAQAAVPAPPGTAEAVALEVEGLLGVAHTKAQADQVTGEATANALELGGRPLLGNTGGTQTGPGRTEGALLDTGDIGIGRVAVAPFAAQVETLVGQRRAQAEAALLRLVLLSPALLTIDLLQSFSEATHRDSTSTGSGSSDGAVVTLGGEGGLRIVLLHAEGDTTNGSSSFVVGLNGTELITNEDIGQTVKVIDLPGLLTLGLVDVGGGAGTGAVSAVGANLQALGSVTGTVTGIEATGSPVAAAAPAPSELGAGDTGSGTGGGGGLPTTGAALLGITALAVALIGAGSLIYRYGRHGQLFGI